jgi:hypothetical protein
MKREDKNHPIASTANSPTTEEARIVRLLASSEPWRTRLRCAFPVSVERPIGQTSIGFTATPDMQSPSGRLQQVLESYETFRNLVHVVDTVVRVQSLPDGDIFEFQDEAVLNAKNPRRILKTSEDARRFLAAVRRSRSDVAGNFPVSRIHPYVDVLKTAAFQLNVDATMLSSWRMMEHQRQQMNEAVALVRTSSRALSSAHRCLLVQLREGARKNGNDLRKFLQQMASQMHDIVARCFVAGLSHHLTGDSPRLPPKLHELATAINVLGARLRKFVEILRHEYRRTPYLRRAGFVWKLEYCQQVGPRFFFVVLLPAGHPLLSSINQELRNVWIRSGSDQGYLEPLAMGLSRKEVGQTFADLTCRLIDRVADVDRYVKLDLPYIADRSGQELMLRTTLGKVALHPM